MIKIIGTNAHKEMSPGSNSDHNVWPMLKFLLMLEGINMLFTFNS